ncbi:MAG: hypothetical protein Q9M09_03845 [Mariprofundaceae bacterium]|nr:hypothetical protein [Mariprofundaceae bacterium]
MTPDEKSLYLRRVNRIRTIHGLLVEKSEKSGSWRVVTPQV